MALLDVVIDVSDAQGRIDWPSVANTGVKVAIVKATESDTFTASTWHANLRGATGMGIKVIPYHFIGRGRIVDQFAHFQSVVGLTHGMAYALDWEGHRTAAAADVQQMGEALADTAGRMPLGYWGIPGSTPETPTQLMDGWDRWVPRYPVRGIADFNEMPLAHEVGPVPFLFWQYTSEGRVPGITGPVDRSVASFEDIEQLIRWCG